MWLSGVGRSFKTIGIPLLAATASVLLVSTTSGVPAVYFMKDVARVLGGPWYAGLLSQLGIMATVAAASVCLFAAPLHHPDLRRLLRSLGFLLIYMSLDDAFQLHEEVMPIYLGVPEGVALGTLYPVLFSLFIVDSWRTLFARTPYWLFFSSLAFGGLSVAIDLSPFEGRLATIEDAVKIVALALLTTFAVSVSAPMPSLRVPDKGVEV